MSTTIIDDYNSMPNECTAKCLSVGFSCFAQRIVSRDDIVTKKDLATSQFHLSCFDSCGIYEILFRPNDVDDVEAFYDELDAQSRILLTKRHLFWMLSHVSLFQNISDLKLLSFNIEAQSLSKNKFLLARLNMELSKHSIGLMVEVTERERCLDKEVLKELLHLSDLGVEVAIDDLSVTELNDVRLDYFFIKYIKVKFDDLKFFLDLSDSGSVFLKWISQGKRIVVENVETLDELHRSLCVPAVFFQGWLFGKPILLG